MTLDSLFQFAFSTVWILVVFFIVLQLAALMTWLERKLSAMIQDRIGPNRANIRIGRWNFTLIGLIHIMCDPIKLFTKEDFIPDGANKALHTLAPMIGLIIPFVVFAVIPWAGPLHITWKDIPADTIPVISSLAMFNGGVLHLSDYYLKFVISDLDVGILFVFAISSLAIYSVILAGWASNNKFSFLGAIRGASQMISYEVAMGLTVVGIIMIYGGVSLNSIVEQQGELMWGVVPKWGIFTQPLALFLFMACGMAEIKRVPFDLPEGESEIVAGYFTEYSSTKFTMFMFAEFVEVIVLSAVCTTLFLGGWQIPWINAEGWQFLSYEGLWADTSLAESIGMNGIAILISVLQGTKFMFCLLAVLYTIFMARWTYPRFRYDQVMNMGWKMILPLALINILITGVVLAFTRGMI